LRRGLIWKNVAYRAADVEDALARSAERLRRYAIFE
jgi:hypothetical protein